MKKLILIALALFISACAAPAERQEYVARIPPYTEKIDTTPDLLQTDSEARLPGGGKTYCAPAVVSNSLIWLSQNGYENLAPKGMSQKKAQIQIAHILGSKEYMDTSLKDGTGSSGVLKAAEKYIWKCGYEFNLLKYQGWRKHPKKYSTGVDVPNIDWIREGIVGDSAVWLNIGWYKYGFLTDQYRRIGGHWVTLVGYGIDKNGNEDPNILIIHDPAPRAGRSFANEYVRIERINSGKLTGKKSGLPRSAKGFYRLRGGMHVNKNANRAILDGVVVLRM